MNELKVDIKEHRQWHQSRQRHTGSIVITTNALQYSSLSFFLDVCSCIMSSDLRVHPHAYHFGAFEDLVKHHYLTDRMMEGMLLKSWTGRQQHVTRWFSDGKEVK